jgi:hypothetical protein
MFNVTDEKLHAAMKRPVAHAYAMSSLVDYEPHVDSTSQILVEQLSRMYADTGEVCDLGEWLQWYAFDVGLPWVVKGGQRVNE